MNELGRVAITGGSGRIGTAVALELRAHGYEVRLIDVRPPKGGDPDWVYGDTSDRSSLAPALAGCQSLVHLGEAPGQWGAMLSEKFFVQNARCGATTFQLAAELGIARIAYASSCQVYGSWGWPQAAPAYLPIDEEHPLRPQGAYPAAKVAVEAYGRMIADTHGGMRIVALRLPGTWRVDYRPAWEDVAWLRKGSQVHSEMGTYLHGSDAGRGFRLALERGLEGFHAYSMTARDVASLHTVREILAEAHPDYPPLPSDWPDFASPVDCSKAERDLGWRAEFSIREILLPLVAECGEPPEPTHWRRPWW